jgi:hypothetical protein
MKTVEMIIPLTFNVQVIADVESDWSQEQIIEYLSTKSLFEVSITQDDTEEFDITTSDHYYLGDCQDATSVDLYAEVNLISEEELENLS